MIVSFKLETDPSILMEKARYALKRYNHQLVIGNLLQKRSTEVTFVTPNKTNGYPIKLNDSSDNDNNRENICIEELIVPEVIKLHEEWMESSLSKEATPTISKVRLVFSYNFITIWYEFV